MHGGGACLARSDVAMLRIDVDQPRNPLHGAAPTAERGGRKDR
jgi:hypothetical protein